MISEINGKDLLMLLLYAPGIAEDINEPILGRTKIVKMLFLFEKELKKDFLKNNDVVIFEFLPYLYGPYSREVVEDLNFLIESGFIKAEDTAVPISDAGSVESEKMEEDEKDDLWAELQEIPAKKENFEQQYYLSDKGSQYVQEKLWNNLEEYQETVITRLKAQINRIPLDELLRYVYRKYPEYAENSTIREKYL